MLATLFVQQRKSFTHPPFKSYSSFIFHNQYVYLQVHKFKTTIVTEDLIAGKQEKEVNTRLTDEEIELLLNLNRAQQKNMQPKKNIISAVKKFFRKKKKS